MGLNVAELQNFCGRELGVEMVKNIRGCHKVVNDLRAPSRKTEKSAKKESTVGKRPPGGGFAATKKKKERKMGTL